MSEVAASHYYQNQTTTLLKEKRYFFYLGLCTILLIGTVFYAAFMQKPARLADTKKIDSTYMAPKIQTQVRTYIIKETDSLSSIAQEQLGDGDKWVDIAKINNIGDPNTVTAGMKILLPTGAAIISATATPTPIAVQEPQGDIGTGAMTKRANPRIKEYTVQEGEGLWQIAEKVYGDGEMWGEIMKENNLTNPDQIYTGMKLKMPHTK